ncbi:MAG: hypothetical protein WCX64_02795 [Candidatus Micrarchaeia archaeon]|jgi:hypothetical protein
MAFIRTKRVKGILYRYRVESTRVGGKVQQRVLEYLGRASAKPSKAGKPKAKKAAKRGAKAAAKAARKGARKAAGRMKTKAKKGGRNKKKRK